MLMVGVHFDALNAWSGVKQSLTFPLPLIIPRVSPILHACPSPIPVTPPSPIRIPISEYKLHLFSALDKPLTCYFPG